MSEHMTRTRAYQQNLATQRHAQQVATQQAAEQAEIAHRSKSTKDFDKDEMLAACGVSPCKPRHQ